MNFSGHITSVVNQHSANNNKPLDFKWLFSTSIMMSVVVAMVEKMAAEKTIVQLVMVVWIKVNR